MPSDAAVGTLHGRLPAAPRGYAFSVPRLRRAALWLFVACSATAIIEPSPYEAMFFVTLALHARGGLAWDRTMAPLVVALALINAAGLLALAPVLDDGKAVMFVAISLYMAMTAIVFAALVAADPRGNLGAIRSGYVAAGVIAALAAVLGYFNVAGLGAWFSAYDNARASGPFKDPNVFGPFLALPMTWLVQDMLIGRRSPLVSLPLLGLMGLGLLLSFSRGAWGVALASIALMAGATFLTTRSSRLRRRIAIVALAGAASAPALFAGAMTIPSVRDMMEIRASLDQDYDVGEMGRFGAQARSVPLLLDRPFGFGPLQYHNVFPSHLDPHEVYVNAFASYGWLGGVAFLGLTATTAFVALGAMVRASPLQDDAIAVGAC